MKKTMLVISLFFFCSANLYSQQNNDTLQQKDSLIVFSNESYRSTVKEVELNSFLNTYKSSIAICYKKQYYFGDDVEKILRKVIDARQDFLIINDRKKIILETKNEKIRYLIQVVPLAQ